MKPALDFLVEICQPASFCMKISKGYVQKCEGIMEAAWTWLTFCLFGVIASIYLTAPLQYVRFNSYLNDSHAEASLFCQLLPDVPGWLRSLREGRFQDLELLCLDGCSGATSLATRPIFGPALIVPHLELVVEVVVHFVVLAKAPRGYHGGRRAPTSGGRTPGRQRGTPDTEGGVVVRLVLAVGGVGGGGAVVREIAGGQMRGRGHPEGVGWHHGGQAPGMLEARDGHVLVGIVFLVAERHVCNENEGLIFSQTNSLSLSLRIDKSKVKSKISMLNTGLARDRIYFPHLTAIHWTKPKTPYLWITSRRERCAVVKYLAAKLRICPAWKWRGVPIQLLISIPYGPLYQQSWNTLYNMAVYSLFALPIFSFYAHHQLELLIPSLCLIEGYLVAVSNSAY